MLSSLILFLVILIHFSNAGCGSNSLHSLGIKTEYTFTDHQATRSPIYSNIHINNGDWTGWFRLQNPQCADFKGGWDFFYEFSYIFPYKNIDGIAIYTCKQWKINAFKWNEPGNNGVTKLVEIDYFVKINDDENTTIYNSYIYVNNTINTVNCTKLELNVSGESLAKQWNGESSGPPTHISKQINTLDAEYWITICLIGLLGMIINGLLLVKEMKHRKSGNTQFTTKYLSWFSLLCILCGFIIDCCIFLKSFNGLCYFMGYIENTAFFLQPMFMGFYQLSRLYYCFAEKKVHSNAGYPYWVFIVMYGAGIIGAIFITISRNDRQIKILCGINENYQYLESFSSVNFSRLWWQIGAILISIMYLLWDIATLSLYLFQIYRITRYQNRDVNQQKILGILHRILIPTLFYEIIGMSLIAITIITYYSLRGIVHRFGSRHGFYQIVAAFLFLSASILLNYAMFIMLESKHNEYEYTKFLKRLQYICCCCKNKFNQQLKLLNELKVMKDVNDNNNNKNDDARTEEKSTLYETHGISENHGKIEGNGCDLINLT